MRDEDLRRLCRKLRPVLGARADALWNAYATAETPQSKLESESLIQMLAIQYLSGSVQEDPILLPPPLKPPDSSNNIFHPNVVTPQLIKLSLKSFGILINTRFNQRIFEPFVG